MRKLVVSRGTAGRLRVERWDGETLVRRAQRDLGDENAIRKLARRFEVPYEDMRAAITTFERDGRSEYPIEEVDNATSLTFQVRGIRSPDAVEFESTNVLEDLAKILATDFGVEEPVLLWDNVKLLAAIDLDAAEGFAWDDQLLQHFLSVHQPKPCFAWVTHGAGLRLLYVPQAGLTAEDIAALSFLNLTTLRPYDSLELKRITRHPLGIKSGRTCGPVYAGPQECDRRSLNAWFNWVDAAGSDVRRWLEEHGFEIGHKYPHSMCPVQPTATATGQPVMVGERGIKCFVCEAHGVLQGSSRAGWFPWASLVGRGTAVSHLESMVTRMSHWAHAEHVLRARFDAPDNVLRCAYRAAMVLCHPECGPDAVNRVFWAGRNLVRYNRRWCTTHGETYDKTVLKLLTDLPVTIRPDGTADKEAFVGLAQAHDITEYGYPHLTPILGCRIWTHNNPHPGYPIVVQLGELRDPAKAHLRPRYVPPKERMNIHQAWLMIELSCPGVNRKLVELLITAKGWAECGLGLPPMVFITGPTSAAKTSTIKLAAAICGDVNSDVVINPDAGRTRQALLEACDRGSFVTFNEVTKVDHRTSARAAMDLLLNFTPDSLVHKLYVGSVPLGRMPVFAWTDTAIPTEVRTDAQLARRLIHVHLPMRVEWADTLLSTIGGVHNARLANELYAEACNSILSEVIDKHFVNPTSFVRTAAELGFQPLERGEDADTNHELLKQFFRAVCEAPEITGSDLVRYKGGWRRIDRGSQGDLPALWEQLRDGTEVAASRACSSVDWQKIMGAKEHILFEVKSSGPNVVFVRFRSADTARKHRFGKELL